MLSDYEITFEGFLKLSDSPCTEIYKSLNNLNPGLNAGHL